MHNLAVSAQLTEYDLTGLECAHGRSQQKLVRGSGAIWGESAPFGSSKTKMLTEIVRLGIENVLVCFLNAGP